MENDIKVTVHVPGAQDETMTLDDFNADVRMANMMADAAASGELFEKHGLSTSLEEVLDIGHREGYLSIKDMEDYRLRDMSNG